MIRHLRSRHLGHGAAQGWVALLFALAVVLLACGGTATTTIVRGGGTATATGASGGHPTATATTAPHQPTATATNTPPHPTPTNTPTPAPPYFIQKATASNSTYDYTVINNPYTNGNTNAKLMVTPNWNPPGNSGTYDNHPIGVYYTSGKWAIFNQDGTSIPTGATFNVWVVPNSDNPFVWTAGTNTTSSDYTTINMPSLNGDSSAWLLVTPNWNPGGSGDIYDNHPIGVFYTGSQWAIFNQDLAAMPNGAAFNVVNVETVGGYLATATASNSTSDYTTLPTALTSGRTTALIFITANWNPNGGSTDVYNNHNTGVWYTGSGWAIFNQDHAAVPNGAAFNTTTLGG
jgi:hypothetical protein